MPDETRMAQTEERGEAMPHRPQPTLAALAQAYGLLGQAPYVSALAAQREAYARWWDAERARRLRDHGTARLHPFMHGEDTLG